jgi:hypothetical protein
VQVAATGNLPLAGERKSVGEGAELSL